MHLSRVYFIRNYNKFVVSVCKRIRKKDEHDDDDDVYVLCV